MKDRAKKFLKNKNIDEEYTVFIMGILNNGSFELVNLLAEFAEQETELANKVINSPKGLKTGYK